MIECMIAVIKSKPHSSHLKLEMELSVNPFFGSLAPEGHHLEPHHRCARDRFLQDQQEVNVSTGGTKKNSHRTPQQNQVTKMSGFYLKKKKIFCETGSSHIVFLIRHRTVNIFLTKMAASRDLAEEFWSYFRAMEDVEGRHALCFLLP